MAAGPADQAHCGTSAVDQENEISPAR